MRRCVCARTLRAAENRTLAPPDVLRRTSPSPRSICPTFPSQETYSAPFSNKRSSARPRAQHRPLHRVRRSLRLLAPPRRQPRRRSPRLRARRLLKSRRPIPQDETTRWEESQHREVIRLPEKMMCRRARQVRGVSYRNLARPRRLWLLRPRRCPPSLLALPSDRSSLSRQRPAQPRRLLPKERRSQRRPQSRNRPCIRLRREGIPRRRARAMRLRRKRRVRPPPMQKFCPPTPLPQKLRRSPRRLRKTSSLPPRRQPYPSSA